MHLEKGREGGEGQGVEALRREVETMPLNVRYYFNGD